VDGRNDARSPRFRGNAQGAASALRWFRTAFLGGMPGPVLAESDPVFTELREDPELQEIVECLRARRDEIRRRLGLWRGGAVEPFPRAPAADPQAPLLGIEGRTSRRGVGRTTTP
jgi:hypothetical protein